MKDLSTTAYRYQIDAGVWGTIDDTYHAAERLAKQVRELKVFTKRVFDPETLEQLVPGDRDTLADLDTMLGKQGRMIDEIAQIFPLFHEAWLQERRAKSCKK
jgi:hypothetical protein